MSDGVVVSGEPLGRRESSNITNMRFGPTQSQSIAGLGRALDQTKDEWAGLHWFSAHGSQPQEAHRRDLWQQKDVIQHQKHEPGGGEHS